MRIISGTLRGKKLVSQDSDTTRPTLDRVKEALFNILQFNIRDSIVLDLFAGSGAIGIEALSRGASCAVFCDNDKGAIKTIEQNITNTRLNDKSIIINKDFILALQQLSKEERKFDIIFLDPPYKTDFAIQAVKKIIELKLLKDDGIIIIETDDINRLDKINNIKEIEIYDKRKYGIANLIFIRKG